METQRIGCTQSPSFCCAQWLWVSRCWVPQLLPAAAWATPFVSFPTWGRWEHCCGDHLWHTCCDFAVNHSRLRCPGVEVLGGREEYGFPHAPENIPNVLSLFNKQFSKCGASFHCNSTAGGLDNPHPCKACLCLAPKGLPLQDDERADR